MTKSSEYIEKAMRLRPKRVAAALWLVMAPWAPWAASAEPAAVCAPYEIPIELEFSTNVPEPVVFTTASPEEIAAMARAGRIEDPAHHPSGVTVVETRLSLDSRSFAVHSRPRGDESGGECIYLDKVTASFGWRAHDIYVANNLQPGSCLYNAVLAHEREHAAINDDVLRAYAPRVKAALEEALAREMPAFEKSRGNAVKEVIDRLDASTAKVLADFEREKAKRNAVIDTAEKRLAQTRVCAGGPPPRKPRVHVIPY